MSYWIREWIEAEGIVTIEHAKARIQEKKSRDLLYSLCERQARQGATVVPEAAQQLVAGCGMDLSGVLECTMGDCLKKRVNEVLYRAWHYFDKIVVTGMDAREFMLYLQANGEMEVNHSDLLSHIEVALYVRDVGADDILIFLDRPAFCGEHLDVLAREAGLMGNVTEAVDRLAEIFYEGHNLSIVKAMGELFTIFEHPLLDVSSMSRITDNKLIRDQGMLARQIARDIGHQLTMVTILSAAAARMQSAALGQLTAAVPPVLHRKVLDTTPGDVAFNLSLPVLESVPIKEVLNFRKHEAADFQAFRSALRTAIDERVRALPGADAESVANSVYEDVLEPTLINLDRKVNKAAEQLAKRSAAYVTVGAVLTTVGLLAFAPIAAPGVVIAPIVAPGVVISASGLMASYHEWLKDRREIELSDLHFLWRLTNKAVGHAN